MALPEVRIAPHGVTPEVQRKLVELYRYGVEVEHLVERFGLDRDTVLKHLRGGGEVVKGGRAGSAARFAPKLTDSLLAAMSDQPMRLAEIAGRANRSKGATAVRLTALKARGLVENVSRGVWRRAAR
jgi:DNA-binding MarR family transcriptional regulator